MKIYGIYLRHSPRHKWRLQFIVLNGELSKIQANEIVEIDKRGGNTLSASAIIASDDVANFPESLPSHNAMIEEYTREE